MQHLLTGKLLVIASRTPGVPVTAPSRVAYFPSAAARSMMDWEATGVTAAAKMERVVKKSFMMSEWLEVRKIVRG